MLLCFIVFDAVYTHIYIYIFFLLHSLQEKSYTGSVTDHIFHPYQFWLKPTSQ